MNKKKRGVDMNKIVISSCIACMAMVLSPQTAFSQGTVYLTSLGQASIGSAAVASDSWQAESFFTGKNPGGYVLDSVQLEMTPASGAPDDFTVMLYTDVGINGPIPGTSLGTLIGSTDPSASGLYTYTADSLELAPDTSYFIVVTAGTASSAGAYAWSVENTSSTTSPSGGWGWVSTLSSSSDGSYWPFSSDTVPQFDLTATAIPEPETLYLMSLPGVLFFVWRRWHTKAQA
jgi:hypothetical protein